MFYINSIHKIKSAVIIFLVASLISLVAGKRMS